MIYRTFTIPIGLGILTLAAVTIGSKPVTANPDSPQAHRDHRGEIAIDSFSLGIAPPASPAPDSGQAQQRARTKMPPATRPKDRPRPNYKLVQAWPSKGGDGPTQKGRLTSKPRKPEPLIVPAVQRVREAP